MCSGCLMMKNGFGIRVVIIKKHSTKQMTDQQHNTFLLPQTTVPPAPSHQGINDVQQITHHVLPTDVTSQITAPVNDSDLATGIAVENIPTKQDDDETRSCGLGGSVIMNESSVLRSSDVDSKKQGGFQKSRNYQTEQQGVFIGLLSMFYDITVEHPRKKSKITLPFFTVM